VLYGSTEGVATRIGGQLRLNGRDVRTWAGEARQRLMLSRFVRPPNLGFVYAERSSRLGSSSCVIGHDGLMPDDQFLERVAAHYGPDAGSSSSRWSSATSRIARSWAFSVDRVPLALVVLSRLREPIVAPRVGASTCRYVNVGQDCTATAGRASSSKPASSRSSSARSSTATGTEPSRSPQHASYGVSGG